jgi:hypothetical protein
MLSRRLMLDVGDRMSCSAASVFWRALAGHRGPQELLIGRDTPGSNRLAVYVRMLIRRLRSGEQFAPGHIHLPEATFPHEMPAEHINLKILI